MLGVTGPTGPVSFWVSVEAWSKLGFLLALCDILLAMPRSQKPMYISAWEVKDGRFSDRIQKLQVDTHLYSLQPFINQPVDIIGATWYYVPPDWSWATDNRSTGLQYNVKADLILNFNPRIPIRMFWWSYSQSHIYALILQNINLYKYHFKFLTFLRQGLFQILERFYCWIENIFWYFDTCSPILVVKGLRCVSSGTRAVWFISDVFHWACRRVKWLQMLWCWFQAMMARTFLSYWTGADPGSKRRGRRCRSSMVWPYLGVIWAHTLKNHMSARYFWEEFLRTSTSNIFTSMSFQGYCLMISKSFLNN